MYDRFGILRVDLIRAYFLKLTSNVSAYSLLEITENLIKFVLFVNSEFCSRLHAAYATGFLVLKTDEMLE